MRTLVSNITAGSRLFAALVPDVTVLDVQVEPEVVLLTVTPSSSTAACPRCSSHFARIHSGGMQKLTRTLAREYAEPDSRVNAIGPGATITPTSRSLYSG